MFISPLRQNTNTNANTKYGIKTSKNNKKKPTVPDRRTDKTSMSMISTGSG